MLCPCSLQLQLSSTNDALSHVDCSTIPLFNQQISQLCSFLSNLRLPGFLYKNMICLLILKWGGMQSLAHTLPDCLVVPSLMFLEDGDGGGGVRKRGPAVILHFMTRSVADRIRPPLWLVSV